MAPDVKRSILSLIAVFGILGVGLGIASLMVLGVMGFFGEAEDLGAAFAGALVLIIVLVFAALSGIVVAVVAGIHAARTFTSRNRAVLVAAVASAAGHLALLVALVATLFLGVSVIPTGTDASSGGSEDSSSPVDYAAFFKTLMALGPAALVGGSTACLLWQAPRRAEFAAVPKPAGMAEAPSPALGQP